MNKVDIVTVQELMGHKTLSMTKGYSYPTPEHKKLAVERLNSEIMDTYLDTPGNIDNISIDVSALNH